MRMRFYMTWNVKLLTGLEGVPFSRLQDFYAMARTFLVTSFPQYSPEISITLRKRQEDAATLDIIWDIDLDETPGPWHMPEPFADWAHTQLCINICGYGTSLTIETFRHADFREALDHDELAVEAAERGTRLTADDYPAFRPEAHPDFPEAREVFKLSGAWFWSAPAFPAKPGQPARSSSPMVGPDPEKIYAAWDPLERYLSYAEPRQGAA